MLIDVASAAQLTAALRTAAPGDQIQLQPGDYGDVSLKKIDPGGPVTVVSALPFAPAVLNSLILTDVHNVVFSGLEIQVDKGGKGVQVGGSSDITLDALNVHGTLGDGPAGDGSGLYIRGSERITVSNSEFHELANGVYHDNSDFLTIIGNRFHDIGMDGIRGGGTSDITISDNYFTDFSRGAGVHADAIQFWTSNTKSAAHDIVVTDNVFDRGEGTAAQGIFLGNEWNMAYVNVTITGNVIIGGMPNGIGVGIARNVYIADNIVLGFTDMASKIRVESSDQVTLIGNTTSHYVFAKNTANFYRDDTPTSPQIQIGDDARVDSLIASHHPELVPGWGLYASTPGFGGGSDPAYGGGFDMAFGWSIWF